MAARQTIVIIFMLSRAKIPFDADDARVGALHDGDLPAHEVYHSDTPFSFMTVSTLATSF